MEHKSKLTRDTAATQPPLTDTERDGGEREARRKRRRKGEREVKMEERMEREERQSGRKIGEEIGKRSEEKENCKNVCLITSNYFKIRQMILSVQENCFNQSTFQKRTNE